MSNNKLLTETTIRRFMKLANVESLTDNFIAEAAPEGEKKSEEKHDEKNKKGDQAPGRRDYAGQDAAMNEQEEPEIDMDEEPEMDMDDEPEMDMDDEPGMDMDDEPGAADISLTEEEARLLIDLGERLSAAMDEDMGDEDMGDEPDMDLGDELDDEAPDMEADEELGDEDPGYRAMQENKSAIVNEVLKRVTKRIIAEKLNRR